MTRTLARLLAWAAFLALAAAANPALGTRFFNPSLYRRERAPEISPRITEPQQEAANPLTPQQHDGEST